MPAAHIYSDNILVALHQKSGETYIHSIGIGCLIYRHRQRACVLFRSLCTFWQSSTTRISRGSARAVTGSWQQRHASLHSHAALCTSAVTLTRRSCSRSRRPSSKISGLFRRRVLLRRNVSLARCPGRLLMSPSGIQPPIPSHHTISQAPYTCRCLHIFSSSILLRNTHRD